MLPAKREFILMY